MNTKRDAQVREANLRRRKKLREAGMEPINFWVHGLLKEQLIELAYRNNETITDLLVRILEDAVQSGRYILNHPSKEKSK